MVLGTAPARPTERDLRREVQVQPTMSSRTDYSSLAIRLLLLVLTALGVIGIFLVAPAEAVVSTG